MENRSEPQGWPADGSRRADPPRMPIRAARVKSCPVPLTRGGEADPVGLRRPDRRSRQQRQLGPRRSAFENGHSAWTASAPPTSAPRHSEQPRVERQRPHPTRLAVPTATGQPERVDGSGQLGDAGRRGRPGRVAADVAAGFAGSSAAASGGPPWRAPYSVPQAAPPFPAPAPAPPRPRPRGQARASGPRAAPRCRVRASGGPWRAAPSTRRAQLTVSRIEPWSVMKFSFMISLVGWVILFVAVALCTSS